jgi:TonB family protein
MTRFKRATLVRCLLAASIAAAVPVAKASGQLQTIGQPRVLRMSTGRLLNSAISRPAPLYPAWAGYTPESTVVIKVVIGEEGKVISARLLSGDRLLGWSAIEALRQWRWQPAIVDGSPVKVLGCLSFRLTPNGSVSDGSTEAAVDDTWGSTDADLLSPSAIAQFEQDGEDSRLFEDAPETAVKVNDSNDQPVFVEEARVKSVKPGPPAAGTEDFLSLTNGVFMGAILVLRNTTNKILTSAVVRFTNRQEGTSFEAFAWRVKGDPQDRYPAIIPHMLVPGDPASFEVEVVSARFEFGEIWRSTRPAPDAHLYANSPEPDVNVTSVDSRPVALNSVRPNYTEGARRNKVSGTSRLRLLVGADGSVKRVNIVTPLPDHLTEEAIKVAFQIKFRPAMKSGQPVAFWTTLDVDFSLR